MNSNVRKSWEEQGTAVAASSWIITIAINVTLGILLLVGGPERVTTPSFNVIREYGGYITSGIAFLVVGTLIAIAAAWTPRILAVSLMLGCILHFVLAVGFWSAIVTEPPPPIDPTYPRASLIGPPLFLFIGAVHLIRARFYWRLEPRKADIA